MENKKDLAYGDDVEIMHQIEPGVTEGLAIVISDVGKGQYMLRKYSDNKFIFYHKKWLRPVVYGMYGTKQESR